MHRVYLLLFHSRSKSNYNRSYGLIFDYASISPALGKLAAAGDAVAPAQDSTSFSFLRAHDSCPFPRGKDRGLAHEIAHRNGEIIVVYAFSRRRRGRTQFRCISVCREFKGTRGREWRHKEDSPFRRFQVYYVAVPFPMESRLRMAARWSALQQRGLPGGDPRVLRLRAELVSQHCNRQVDDDAPLYLRKGNNVVATLRPLLVGLTILLPRARASEKPYSFWQTTRVSHLSSFLLFSFDRITGHF